MRVAKWTLLVLCLLGMAALWEYIRWIGSDEYLRRELNKTVLAKVDFRETTAKDALAYCQTRIRQQNPRLNHFTIAFDPKGMGGNIGDTRVTLSLNNISAWDAIDYVSKLSGCLAHVKGREVIVEPMAYGIQAAPAKFHWWQ